MGRGSNGGTTRLPEGMQWAPHCGTRERLRALRRTWARFEKERKGSDLYEDVLDCVARNSSANDDEITALLLVQAATVRAAETGKEFDDLIRTMMAELDAEPRSPGGWDAGT